LHDAWENFQDRGFGFPRFKKFGLQSIPDGFVVKQVRVLSKAREHNGMNHHHPVSGICPFSSGTQQQLLTWD